MSQKKNCPEQRHVQNHDYTSVTPLVVARIQDARTLSFHMYFTDMFEYHKECSFLFSWYHDQWNVLEFSRTLIIHQLWPFSNSLNS